MASVLLLTQVLPYPPDSGPKIKTWNVLKYLAARHEVTLVSFVRAAQEAQWARELQSRGLCRAVFTAPMRRSPLFDAAFLGLSLFTGQSFTVLRDARPAMHRLLRELAAREHFDAVHADQLYMAEYALRLRERSAGRPPLQAGRQSGPGGRLPLLLDTHNAMHVLAQRLARTTPAPMKWLWAFEEPRLRRYEAAACRLFDAVTAVSAEDRKALWQALGARREMPVIPICIDPDEAPRVNRSPSGPNLLHVGTMYWPPNVDGILWFCREVFPLIQPAVPDARFTVAGKNPPARVRALAAHPAICVTGYVDDLPPLVQDSAAMVVPVRSGGGMRVKILEGLAWGLPMVSTTVGAEGIAVENNRDILIADSPADFAAATVRLLTDPALNARLAENGRRLVEEKYDYRTALRPLDEVYERLLAPD
ncbi:MAG: glycosyltransferase [Chloroflexi bacterium]|nr:glycosyltransferase [Chloroflexota bacterium]